MTDRPPRLYDYAASCNCYKVRLLLAHLGIQYERIPIDIFAGETLTDDSARMNPMRTTPVSKSSSGMPSRQPVGHSSMQTRQPLQ